MRAVSIEWRRPPWIHAKRQWRIRWIVLSSVLMLFVMIGIVGCSRYGVSIEDTSRNVGRNPASLLASVTSDDTTSEAGPFWNLWAGSRQQRISALRPGSNYAVW